MESKHSNVIAEIRTKMKNDKWYIKLRRQIDLRIWLVYCLLFNNRFINKMKNKIKIKNRPAS